MAIRMFKEPVTINDKINEAIMNAPLETRANMHLGLREENGTMFLFGRSYDQVVEGLATGAYGISDTGLFHTDGVYDPGKATKAFMASMNGGRGRGASFFREYLRMESGTPDLLDEAEPIGVSYHLFDELKAPGERRVPLDELFLGKPRNRMGLPTGYESRRLFEDMVDVAAKQPSVQEKYANTAGIVGIVTRGA